MKSKTNYIIDVTIAIVVWLLMTFVVGIMVVATAGSPWDIEWVAMIGLMSVGIMAMATGQTSEMIKAARRDYRYRQYQERRK